MLNSALNTASLLNKSQSNKRKSFAWGLTGYRPSTSSVLETLKKRRVVSFDDRHNVRDEARWLALYVTDEDYTMQFLMDKTKLRRPDLADFCEYYGVDLKTRTVIENFDPTKYQEKKLKRQLARDIAIAKLNSEVIYE